MLFNRVSIAFEEILFKIHIQAGIIPVPDNLLRTCMVDQYIS